MEFVRLKGIGEGPPNLPEGVQANGPEPAAEAPSTGDNFDRQRTTANVLPVGGVTQARPSNVHRVRPATVADAETIAAIAADFDLRRNPEVAAHPENGWLWQSATPEQVRQAMGTHKDFWLAEDRGGQAIGYQVICPPRYICGGLANHRLLGPDADRAKEVLRSGRFLYASQLCIKKGAGQPGAARDMQRKVLAHYRWLPLVSHVGCFFASEFEQWDQTSPFRPRTNNVASHHFHQKQGYRLVGYVSSDLHPTLHTGQFEAEPGTEHTSALYLHFRDGAELRYSKQDYVDPIAAILANEVRPEDLRRQRQELTNPWASFPIDVSRIFARTPEGIVPQIALIEQQLLEGAAAELTNLRRRLGPKPRPR